MKAQSESMTCSNSAEGSFGHDDYGASSRDEIGKKSSSSERTTQQETEEFRRSHHPRRAKSKLKNVYQKTKTAYESSLWCIPLRCIGNFPANWPRFCAIVFGIILPLWLLVLLSAGFGAWLARCEMDQEISYNDEILAARADLAYSANLFETEILLERPNVCFDRYDDQYYGLGNNISLSSNETNLTTYNSTERLYNASEISDFIRDCSSSFASNFEATPDIRNDNVTIAFQDLSFNWIRCWDANITAFHPWTFYPSEDLINASRPDAQEETFTEEWNSMQQFLYDLYLPPNATEAEKDIAFFRSIEEATGGSTCMENLPGTAWFFFTIMTTVGYGNQAPVTYEGRMLVYTAGIASLLLFGAVLGQAGFICLSISDDFVSRFSISKWIQNPWVGTVLWGGIWLTFALTLGTSYDMLYEERLPDFEVNREDAIWFAYISTTTIGLGDYYLKPEVMFASDTLNFSLLFLVGFIFLSTFFSKIMEAIGSLVPCSDSGLKVRLKATPIFACWGDDCCGRKAVENSHYDVTVTVAGGNTESEQDEVVVTITDQQQRNEDLKVFLVSNTIRGGDNKSNGCNTGDEDSLLSLIQAEENILKELMRISLSKKRQRLHQLGRTYDDDDDSSTIFKEALSEIPDECTTPVPEVEGSTSRRDELAGQDNDSIVYRPHGCVVM